jgi:hypothetical protein
VGLATAQITGVVLTDVPVAMSGQASGTQSTTRQLGSALGIAVLGTVLFSTVAGHLDAALTDRGLPEQHRSAVVTAVKDSGGAAIPALAADPRTAPVADDAKQAYSTATRWTAFTAAAFLLLGLIASVRLGSGRAETATRPPDGRSARPRAEAGRLKDHHTVRHDGAQQAWTRRLGAEGRSGLGRQCPRMLPAGSSSPNGVQGPLRLVATAAGVNLRRGELGVEVEPRPPLVHRPGLRRAAPPAPPDLLTPAGIEVAERAPCMLRNLFGLSARVADAHHLAPATGVRPRPGMPSDPAPGASEDAHLAPLSIRRRATPNAAWPGTARDMTRRSVPVWPARHRPHRAGGHGVPGPP